MLSLSIIKKIWIKVSKKTNFFNIENKSTAPLTVDCWTLQVVMLETRERFVARYGVYFQDCIGKGPTMAKTRLTPAIALGTMISFTHNCVLAYFFGVFSAESRSYPQLVILVSSSAPHLRFILLDVFCLLLSS